MKSDLRGNLLRIQGNFHDKVNENFRRFSNLIQEGNQKYLFLRGCIYISDESNFSPNPEESKIIYGIDFLVSDLNGSFKLMQVEVDFDERGMTYYDMSGNSDFDNEKLILSEFYDIIFDLFEKIDIPFDRFYWDFNQIAPFKNGYVYKPKEKDETYIILDNEQSYSTIQILYSANEACCDSVLYGTWRKKSN